jgi:GMP synthase-like glutamine amidotransferase
MKIGILMTGHVPESLRSERGDLNTLFAQMLDGHGFDFAAWDVEGMELPRDPHEAEGWLITGSKHGVYEDHPFIPPLEEFIRRTHAADVPLVGICFGHQIVAQALGGRVEKFAGGWSLGRKAYEVAGAEPIVLNAWHQDQVVEAPAGATRLGRNETCANAILAYGDRILTVQAHPEFDAGVIGHFIETRRDTGTYPADRLEAAEAALPEPVDNARMGASVARFLKTREIHV